MVKTTTGHKIKNFRRRSKSLDHNSGCKTLTNGIYVYSSSPKVMNGTEGVASATIREYIRAGNVEALEELVLQGRGSKLISQHAIDPKIKTFLKTVPSYMTKIDLLHDTVVKGNLRELKSLLDQEKLARASDSRGVSLLHKAVLYNHADIVEYLIQDYPETLDIVDNNGRTPLHYCAASRDKHNMFSKLHRHVKDPMVMDNRGKTAYYYMEKPSELNEMKKRKEKVENVQKGKNQKKYLPFSNIKFPHKRKGLNITGANIRIWIHNQDLTKLERIVWEGQGERLLNETSNHTKVRQFLNLVPRMMTKIRKIHLAAIKGDESTLEANVDEPEILLAKDHNGLNPLHKAAGNGHMDICDWICQKNLNTVNASDRRNRTPLFFATIPVDGGETWDTIIKYGANIKHKDKLKKTADQYRDCPNDIDVTQIYELPKAPRSGFSDLDMSVNSRMISLAPSRNQERSQNASRRSSVCPKSPINDPDKKKELAEEKKDDDCNSLKCTDGNEGSLIITTNDESKDGGDGFLESSSSSISESKSSNKESLDDDDSNHLKVDIERSAATEQSKQLTTRDGSSGTEFLNLLHSLESGSISADNGGDVQSSELSDGPKESSTSVAPSSDSQDLQDDNKLDSSEMNVVGSEEEPDGLDKKNERPNSILTEIINLLEILNNLKESITLDALNREMQSGEDSSTVFDLLTLLQSLQSKNNHQDGGVKVETCEESDDLNKQSL